MFGKFIKKGIIMQTNYEEGFKPVVYEDPPQKEGFVAVPVGWEDTGEDIRQIWEFVVPPEPEATDSDYQSALESMGVSV